MKRLLFALSLLLLHPAWAEEAQTPATITPEERKALLERAKSLKAEASRIKQEAGRKRTEANTACWKKTLVSACQRDAHREYLDSMAAARKLGVDGTAHGEGEVRERDRSVRDRFSAREVLASLGRPMPHRAPLAPSVREARRLLGREPAPGERVEAVVRTADGARIRITWDRTRVPAQQAAARAEVERRRLLGEFASDDLLDLAYGPPPLGKLSFVRLHDPEPAAVVRAPSAAQWGARPVQAARSRESAGGPRRAARNTSGSGGDPPQGDDTPPSRPPAGPDGAHNGGTFDRVAHRGCGDLRPVGDYLARVLARLADHAECLPEAVLVRPFCSRAQEAAS